MSDKNNSEQPGEQPLPTPKKRGGPGRKPGVTNKYSGKDIISKYQAIHGRDYLDDMLSDMEAARVAKDIRNLVAYQAMFAKYVFTEIDAVEAETKTSNLSYEELVKIAKLAINSGEDKDGNKTE